MDPELIEFCGRVVDAASDPSLREIDGARFFPKGMCTWMSFAAGELLREHGFGVWKIQNAQQLDGSWLHDWLVRNDLYVDLTAHQFERFETPLIGVGTSPATELFPIMCGRYRTQEISDYPGIVQYKERLSEILGRVHKQ